MIISLMPNTFKPTFKLPKHIPNVNPAYRFFTFSGIVPVPELSTAPLDVMINQRVVIDGRSWKLNAAAVAAGISPFPDFTTMPSRIEREPIVWAHYFWLGQNKRLVQQDGQSGFIALLTAFA